ncbi:crossover junction endonuclease eme1 [Rhizophlyctis rosea]|nr:crossover junction endonuclease eme1 [Rhizophlyctis rosea]
MATPYEEWARNVRALCPNVSTEDVLVDLKKTGSVDLTVNRIFDGQFLEGTERDPSLAFLYEPALIRPQTFEVSTSPPPLPPQIINSLEVEESTELLYTSSSAGLKRKRPVVSDSGTELDRSFDGTQIDFSKTTSSASATGSKSSSLPKPAHLSSDDEVIDLTNQPNLAPLNPSTSRPPVIAQQHPPAAVTNHSQSHSKSAYSSIPITSRLSSRDRAWDFGDDDDDDGEDLLATIPSLTSKPPLPPTYRGPIAPPLTAPYSQKTSLSSQSRPTTPLSDITSSQQSSVIVLSSDDESNTQLSQSSFGSSIGTASSSKRPAASGPSNLKRSFTSDTIDTLSSDLGGADDATPEPKPKRRKRKSDEDVQLAEAAKADKQRQREEAKRAKEEAKLLKQQEREEKQREKQRLKEEKDVQKRLETEERKAAREANKKREKAASIREMIVDISPSFITKVSGSVIDTIKDAGAEVAIVELPIPCSIRWRRRVVRVWDENSNRWVGCPKRIEEEDFALVRFDGEEFARLVVEPTGLVGCAQRLQAGFAGKKIILLVEGLEKYFGARKRQLSSKFMAEVQAAYGAGGGGGGPSAGGQRKGGRQKNTSLAELPDRARVYSEVADLQLLFGNKVVFHECKPGEEAANWVSVFTAQIGQAPELRQVHRSEATFDLRFGDNIKSGANHADTWLKMLQHVAMCSEPKAKAIVQKYPSLRALYKAYERCESAEVGAKLLATMQINLGTSVNPRLRNLGPVLSRRIYESVMIDNPGYSLIMGE